MPVPSTNWISSPFFTAINPFTARTPFSGKPVACNIVWVDPSSNDTAGSGEWARIFADPDPGTGNIFYQVAGTPSLNAPTQKVLMVPNLPLVLPDVILDGGDIVFPPADSNGASSFTFTPTQPLDIQDGSKAAFVFTLRNSSYTSALAPSIVATGFDSSPQRVFLGIGGANPGDILRIFFLGAWARSTTPSSSSGGNLAQVGSFMSWGSGQLSAGNTVTLSHYRSTTPSAILLGGEGGNDNRNMWVSALSSTTFTVTFHQTVFSSFTWMAFD